MGIQRVRRYSRDHRKMKMKKKEENKENKWEQELSDAVAQMPLIGGKAE